MRIPLWLFDQSLLAQVNQNIKKQQLFQLLLFLTEKCFSDCDRFISQHEICWRYQLG